MKLELKWHYWNNVRFYPWHIICGVYPAQITRVLPDTWTGIWISGRCGAVFFFSITSWKIHRSNCISGRGNKTKKKTGVPMCFIKQIAVFVGQPLVSNSSPVDLWLFSEQTRCNVLVTSDKSSYFTKHRNIGSFRWAKNSGYSGVIYI